MKIIPPIIITDTMMVSSNVPETDDTPWSDATTYNTGDTCMVTVRTHSGTVFSNYLASHRGNFIAGNAFFEANATDLTPFVGTDLGFTPYKITLVDAAGKTATGYIAAGGNGRVLGTTMLSDGSFRYKPTDPLTPWTWGAGWGIDHHRAESTNGLLLNQNAGLVVDQLYYTSITVSVFNSGTVNLYYGSTSNTFYARASAATFTEYAMTDGGVTFGANGNGASSLMIDDLFVKAVMEPVAASSGGVHIVSSENGTYRDWASVDAGFDPRRITNYTITQLGQGYHKVYESLIDSNLNKFPPTNTTGTSPSWLELESTNRWRAFDGRTGSLTSNVATIEYSLTPGAFDAIAFFGLDADTIDITLTDPVAGVVYSDTITLDGATEAQRLDIPQYADATLNIIITSTTTAYVSEIILGIQYYIGRTLITPVLAITDYSTKEADEFGNYTFIQRAYSSRNTFDIRILNTSIDAVFETIARHRATPVVWTDDNIAAMLTYGFYKDFNISIDDVTYSACTVEVEGLV